jgi:hypothetical protein
VDGYSSWVRKSDNERARYVIGCLGENIQTQEVYPGLQVEKGGVIGPVKWGPEMRITQDVWEVGEKMLDGHLRSEPRSLDIRKSREMSERPGAKVYTKAWKKYVKDCSATRTAPSKKFGARTSHEHEPDIAGPKLKR